MTNKYLEKIALNEDQKGLAKSYARVSGLSTLGGIAGGVLGAAALGSRAGGKLMSMPLGRKGVTLRGVTRYAKTRLTGSGIAQRYAKLMPHTAGAIAGGFIGSHVGGEVGEYAGIKGSIKDLQKKSSILEKVAEIVTRE